MATKPCPECCAPTRPVDDIWICGACDWASWPVPPARPPHEILADFNAAVAGTADISPHRVLWEVIEDVSSSFRLALQDVLDDERREEVMSEVRDYLTNHYDS